MIQKFKGSKEHDTTLNKVISINTPLISCAQFELYILFVRLNALGTRISKNVNNKRWKALVRYGELVQVRWVTRAEVDKQGWKEFTRLSLSCEDMSQNNWQIIADLFESWTNCRKTFVSSNKKEVLESLFLVFTTQLAFLLVSYCLFSAFQYLLALFGHE